MFQTKNNELGIVKLIAAKWPAEQKERLLRELEAAKQESNGVKSGITTLDNKGE